MIRHHFYLTFLLVVFLFYACNSPDHISLQGKWKFQMDTEEKGIVEQWYKVELTDHIQLPGSMVENGKGYIPTVETQWTGSIYDSSWYFNPAMEKYRQPGNTKFPFWLTPDRYYVGVAWYQRGINIPARWKDKRIILFLERPHWQTTVWLDTTLIGSQNSLSTPHVFELVKENIQPGKHLLTIRVDNAIHEMDPGINAHSITDHTQGNWNGIAGRIELSAESLQYIGDVTLIPDLSNNKVSVRLSLKGIEKLHEGLVEVVVKGSNHKHSLPVVLKNIEHGLGSVQLEYPMGKDFKTWDEFSPNLYEMIIRFCDKTGTLDIKKVTFGMRAFTVAGTRFQINGRTLFLRGTTDCCVYPLTGYPPTDEAVWTRVFEICKSYGLNHMRFHSYCPPEAAFIAADNAGIYLQVEGPSWAKYSTSLGYGKPIDQYLYEETERILKAYGNHPSFCMMAYGNEPSGNYVAYLEEWVGHFKNRDPQRVYCGASTGRSWEIIPNSDFIVRSPPRGLEWDNKQPDSEFDYRDKLENQVRPYISFEMGQWCAFPNFEEIKKYTGPLKAKNLELFREDLNDKHMGRQAHDFLMASGKLQVSCYKQEIEAALRTPQLAGFQLLSLNDFLGQGTALVGVLDAFWEEKGYISAEEFNRFCNSVFPLARMPKFIYSNADTFISHIEVANFSLATLKNARIQWKIINKQGVTVVNEPLSHKDIPIGNCHAVGTIHFPLQDITEAQKLTLEVSLNEYKNSWNFWVYPSQLDAGEYTDIYFCDSLDSKARQILSDGGKVFLHAAGTVEHGKDVVQYLTPVFWNTSWFRMRPPHTTGILIQDKHPALKEFPTDYYSDLQWWEIANKQQVMNLDSFPPDFWPIIQPIDTWFLNRRLAMLFEAKVGNGSLMVCSIDLNTNMENRLVASQLLYSLKKYMHSEQFAPHAKVELSVIEELFEKKNRPAWNAYVMENP